MQITVTIPDELVAQVKARGFALETYVRDLMEEDLSHERGDKIQRWNAVEAMLRFAERHGVTSGGQDIKSMIHEEHKH